MNAQAVAWLERNYDQPYAFAPPLLHSPVGLFVLKDDHGSYCLCETPQETETWPLANTAAKWKAGAETPEVSDDH